MPRRTRNASRVLPGEKKVRATTKTVPVKPPRVSRAAKKPVPISAVDQRKQIVGSDELKAKRGAC